MTMTEPAYMTALRKEFEPKLKAATSAREREYILEEFKRAVKLMKDEGN